MRDNSVSKTRSGKKRRNTQKKTKAKVSSLN